MVDEIDALLNEDSLALHYRQALEPVDGRDVPIFPPTYPAARRDESHRHDTPYTVNPMRDGTLVATLDSVPSQSNRMERCFGKDGPLQHVVPDVRVKAGTTEKHVADLGHRIADAAIRSTCLDEEIRAAFEAYDQGVPTLIARLCPTALIYGAWDSRDTRVKIPRAVRSEVIARDVDVFTRSAQFAGTFSQDELEIPDTHWRPPRRGEKSAAASAGFAQVPAVNEHGGVMVRGEIYQSVAIHLAALAQMGRDGRDALPPYLLSLALAALLDEQGGRNYILRVGCWLAPASEPAVSLVSRNGRRVDVALDRARVQDWLKKAKEDAEKEPLGIRCDDPKVGTYTLDRAKVLMETADKDE